MIAILFYYFQIEIFSVEDSTQSGAMDNQTTFSGRS